MERTIQRIKNDGAINFEHWPLEDLLQVWRDRKPVAVIAGREPRIFHLDIAASAPDAEYVGMTSGLSANPRAMAIEDAAWKATDAEFERRANRAYKDATGNDAKKAAFLEAIRENNNARVFVFDFGSRTNSAADAPDILWHLARTILEKMADEKVGKHTEIREIFTFYPDLLTA